MRHFAPTRKSTFICAALAGVLFHPGLVSAVALGNVALQSSLGQPLRLVIPVALNRGETLNAACLKLMRDSQPGTPQLLTGRVNIEPNAASTRLIVTTPRAIDEPALRVSVQAGCGNTVRRDYVLLLDPQGLGSVNMMAAADLDEFKHYVGAARPDKPIRRSPRVEVVPEPSMAPKRSIVAVVDPAPARTEFTPIAPPASPAPVAAPRATAVVKEATAPNRAQPDLPLKEIPDIEKKALNRPVTDLARTGDKEVIDVITGHPSNHGNGGTSAAGNGNGPGTSSDRVTVALGSIFMGITCSVCGSDKVIRAGACGVCTECGTSQGCS